MNPEIDPKKILMNKKLIHPHKKHQISFDGDKLQPFWIKRSQTKVLRLQEEGSMYSDLNRIYGDRASRSLTAAIPTIVGTHRLEFNPNHGADMTQKGFRYLCENIKKLASLTSINLNFRGPFDLGIMGVTGIWHLSQSLKNLINLQDVHIRLDELEITDNDIKYLAKSLKGLPCLKNLNLTFFRCNGITDKGLQCLNKSLTKIASLQNVDLNFNEASGLTNTGLVQLRKGLKKLKNLQKINLNFSFCEQLDGSEIISPCKEPVTSTLKNFNLDLSYCTNFSHEGAKNLSDFLKCLPALQRLKINLSNERVTSDLHIDFLGQGLENLTVLETLHLRLYNCWAITEISCLNQSLMKLQSLKHLTLNFTRCDKICDNGQFPFGKALMALISLQTLHLDLASCPNLVDSTFLYMKEGLKNLTSLQKIYLNLAKWNPYSKIRMQDFSEGLSSHGSLIDIELIFGNDDDEDPGLIEDESIHKLSEALKANASLQRVSLDFKNCNQITDEAVEKLGLDLSTLGSLEEICLVFEECKKITRPVRKTIEEALKTVEKRKLYFNDDIVTEDDEDDDDDDEEEEEEEEDEDEEEEEEEDEDDENEDEDEDEDDEDYDSES